MQPCTDAILANLQPRSTRYSDACKFYLLHKSEEYFKRYMFCVWANQCEVNWHERQGDAFDARQSTPMLEGVRPVKPCLIMEFRHAREREQKEAFRNDCLTSFHLNQEEQELLEERRHCIGIINARTAAIMEKDRRLWGTEGQRAILATDKWREAVAATRGVQRARDGVALPAVPSFTGNGVPSVWPPMLRADAAAAAAAAVAAADAQIKDLPRASRARALMAEVAATEEPLATRGLKTLRDP